MYNVIIINLLQPNVMIHVHVKCVVFYCLLLFKLLLDFWILYLQAGESMDAADKDGWTPLNVLYSNYADLLPGNE